MKAQYLLLALAPFLAVLGTPERAAAHSASGVLENSVEPSLATPQRENLKGCFAEYKGNLKNCKSDFCPNVLFNCDNTLLRACIDGAKTVLGNCIEKE